MAGIFIPIGKNYDYYHGLGGVWGELRHDKQMTTYPLGCRAVWELALIGRENIFMLVVETFFLLSSRPDCAGSADLK